MGRVDDVINVSGHRLGTAEIESALVFTSGCFQKQLLSECRTKLKGQSIYAYVTLKAEFDEGEDITKELRNHVRKEIGPLAAPEVIQFFTISA